MRLTECEPYFLKVKDKTTYQYLDVPRAEADGIQIVCPRCLLNNNMQRPGCHSIICWQPNVPQDISPSGGRWVMRGTNFEDLSLDGSGGIPAGSGGSSILLPGEGCGAHFFIINGEIKFT